MMKYRRTLQQLEEKAVYWWPEQLGADAATSSILPLLLETQEKFISILSLVEHSPFDVLNILEASQFPANLFVKHLEILADVGGEPIQRLNQQFKSLFPTDKFHFYWKGEAYTYSFESLPVPGLNNKKLHVDGKSLAAPTQLGGLEKDVIMLLLYGASASDMVVAQVLHKCEIGVLLGEKDALQRFIKQRYIAVSRIVTGAQANTLGQFAQGYVLKFLKGRLGDGYLIRNNVSLPVESGNSLPFDIVVSKDKIHVAVEVSFQVTTNSTIERKSGQAQDRQALLHREGNYIAYILDGAGNFARSSALNRICDYSDCTIAYHEDEFELLAQFIEEVTA